MENSLIALANQSADKRGIKKTVQANEKKLDKDIAIIGMAGRIGDSDNLTDFFQKVLEGYDFITDLPEDRKKDADEVFQAFYPDENSSDVKYVKGGYLKNIDLFDYDFFGMPYIEMETMDPTQRAIFEAAIQSIWDAGYTERQLDNSKTGVFIGNSNTAMETYKQLLMKYDESLRDVALAGNLNSVLSSRISYYLNLKGSSMVIDTACSSGMVALHTACEELKRGSCNLAIVAGAKLNLLPPIQQEGNLAICSDDGYTRTFDANSSGTGIGEGVISLVLKELKEAERDKDQIYAVIKGSAINQDGKSVGITAPNAQSQKNLLLDTWKKSGIKPTQLQYIEAHGTATKIGDVIEIESITEAFREYTDARQICAIGSVKSNVGHTDAISGLAGIVKCVYALRQRKIPATIHFDSPNKEINFIESPVYVNGTCQDWNMENGKRTCSVNSFGLSGTNACVVLQEYDRDDTEAGKNVKTELHDLWITAKDKTGLLKYVKEYTRFVRSNSSINLDNLCYTANERREQYEYQVKVTFQGYDQLVEKLSSLYRDMKEDKAVICQKEERAKHNYCDEVHCISIPEYPLKRKRCWISKRGSILPSKKNNLVSDLLIATIKESVFHMKMSLGTQWEIGEHRVNDRYLLVGTSYIEMITQIAKEHYNIENVHIFELILQNGLYTEEPEPIEFQIYVEPHEDKYTFEMDSMQNGVRTIHCKGAFNDDVEDRPAPVKLDSIIDAIDETMKISPEIYLYGLVSISERWHVTQNIYIGKDYYVAEIEIPDMYKSEAKDYVLYPTALDAALNFSNTLQGNSAYLPWQYGQIEVYHKLPAKLYSLIKVPDKIENDEVLKFDVVLVDEVGNVAAVVKDYVVKKIEAGKDSVKNSLSFSKRMWVPVSEEDIEEERFEKNVVFYQGDKMPLEIPNYRYQKIVEGTEAEYEQFLNESGDVDRVIFDASMQGEVNQDNINLQYKYNYSSFISFMKSIIHLGIDSLKEILVVANNGYEVEGSIIKNPFGASLAAGLKSLKYEFPNYTFRYLDYEESERDVLAKFLDCKTDAVTTAVRHGILYQEQVKKIKTVEEDETKIRENGAYVITGGLGGVGLTTATALADAGAKTIILMGRKRLQSIEDAKEQPYTKSSTAGDVIESLKEQGVTVEYHSVDVSEYDDLKKALQKIQTKYGDIYGVIHTAGIPGEGLFYRKPDANLHKVLAVKVKGLCYINAIIKELQIQPDFCVACSSFTALAGSVGQWDYAVANEFMDIFCQSMNQSGNTKFISAIWTTWAEAGMAYRYGFKREECLIEPINNEEGKEYFEKLFRSKMPELIIGRWNNQLLKNKDCKLNIQFYNRVHANKIQEEAQAELAASVENDISLIGIKKSLTKLWIRVLGRDDFDEEDKFFEMEGNSILATYLLNEINQVYDNIFDITDIFTYSSITDMAEAIYKKVAKPEKKVVGEVDELDALLQELVDGKVTVDDIKSKI